MRIQQFYQLYDLTGSLTRSDENTDRFFRNAEGRLIIQLLSNASGDNEAIALPPSSKKLLNSNSICP